MDTIQYTLKENSFYPLLQLSRKNKKNKKKSSKNTKVPLVANSKSKNQMKKKAKQNMKKKAKQNKIKLELDLENIIKNISKLNYKN